MPSRKCAALRTALPNRNKNWLPCFHNEDADDGKKSNDLISLQPKWNKNSCRSVTAEQVFQGSPSGEWLSLIRIVFTTAWTAPADTLWNLEEPPQRARKIEEACAQSQISSLTDAQMKSPCEPLFAQAKLLLKSMAGDLGLFQVHVTPRSGWIPPPQAKPHSFSVLWSTESFSLNSVLLERLTALLGVALKNVHELWNWKA